MHRTALPLAVLLALAACVAPPAPPPAAPPPPPAVPDLPPADGASRRLALLVVVPDAAKAAAAAEERVKPLGGYVTAREVPEARPGLPREALLTLSVDGRQADAAAARLEELGTPGGRRSQVEDVTAATVDLNARMAALRETESRLRARLEGPDRDCAAAGGLEAERAKALSEMAALMGRVKVQESRSQYASVTVRLAEAPPPAPPAVPPSFTGDVGRAWMRLKDDPAGAVRDGAVAVVASLPVILVLVLPALSRRRRQALPRPPKGGTGVPPAA